MELITVREIFAQPDAYMDKEVTVGGWVRSIRDSKTFGFIVLSDGTCFEPFRLYIMIPWRTLQRSQSAM